MGAEFDEYEAQYDQLMERSIGFAGRDHSFYIRVKVEYLLALIRRYIGDPSRQRVLDRDDIDHDDDRHDVDHDHDDVVDYGTSVDRRI